MQCTCTVPISAGFSTGKPDAKKKNCNNATKDDNIAKFEGLKVKSKYGCTQWHFCTQRAVNHFVGNFFFIYLLQIFFGVVYAFQVQIIKLNIFLTVNKLKKYSNTYSNCKTQKHAQKSAIPFFLRWIQALKDPELKCLNTSVYRIDAFYLNWI